jgi:hypothetical protein
MIRLYNYNFSDTVVMVKTYSPLYSPASAVRNAQAFGARAVILFPDPNNYILSKASKVGEFAWRIQAGLFRNSKS